MVNNRQYYHYTYFTYHINTGNFKYNIKQNIFINRKIVKQMTITKLFSKK